MRDGQTLVRSSAPYAVHDDVHQHLDFGEHYYLSLIYNFCIFGLGSVLTLDTLLYFCCTVGGLHRFPPKGQILSKEKNPSKAKVHLGVTPSVLRARYNLTAADVGTAQNNSQAVAQV